MYLLDQISRKNKDDLELALNAHSVLMEFTDNDHCFGLLTANEPLQKLISICCQGLVNNNLRYSMHLLLTIINEFSNTEKEIPDERKAAIHQLFAKFFQDIAYNCVGVMMTPHENDQ